MSIIPEDDTNKQPVDKGTFETPLEAMETRSVDDDAPRALTPEDEKRLWRKVDLRLMPILSVMYLFSFMDRGTSNKFSCTIPS